MKGSRIFLIGILALLLLVNAFALVGCDEICNHQWSQATCTSPKKCSLCNKTEGKALGHTPEADDGDCTTAVICSVCEVVVTQAKTAHAGGTATCFSRAHCSACEQEYGELAAHTWSSDAATEEFDKHCTVCGFVAEEQIGHTHQFESVLSYDDEGHYYASTCGHPYAKKDYAAHRYESDVTDPTCTEQGYTTYTCACGKTYKDDYLPASGHDFGETLTYDNGGHWYEATCEHDVKKEYAAHDFQSAVTKPTCTEQGYTTYTCECGYSYVGDYVSETGHTVTNWSEAASTLHSEESCQHAVRYTGICSACNQPREKTEYVEKHAWTYAVKPGCEATCQATGIKLTYCKNESCQYHGAAKGEITYSDPSAHAWVEDLEQTIDGMTSYHCTVLGCSATKNTVSSSGTTANVPSGNVGSLDEVELNNAVIGFDQGIKDKLSESLSSVEISAGTLEGGERATAISDANLTPEQEALLGNKEIYNFTVTTTENVSNLGGTATVRIPYELGDEDPDHIIVWYISNGKLTGIPASYADGYVTFTTTHFSYYVATTVAPEALCEYLNEHDLTNVHTVPPTCTEGGYSVCIRCGRQIEGSETAPLGHEWHTTVLAENTCTANGKTKYECSVCELHYETVVSATGHRYVLKEQKNATCTQSGYTTHVCDLCESAYTVTLPQSDHRYVTNVVSPTCEASGYSEKSCSACGDTFNTNYVDALGHSYTDGICTVCGDERRPCYTYESETLILTLYSDETVFVAEYGFDIDADGKLDFRESEGSWHQTNDGKIHVYTEIDEYVFVVNASGELTSDSCSHERTEKTTAEATCTEDGYVKTVCSDCGEVVRREAGTPALGHAYNTNGVCTRCGAFEDGSEEDLPLLIEEAVSNAIREWRELRSKGVDIKIIMNFESQYRSIVDDMQFAESIEVLEEYKKMFDHMILQIMKMAGGDVTEPEVCAHEKTEETVSAATCIKDGYRTVTCTDCGEVVKRELVFKALGHAYDDSGICERCGTDEAGSESLLGRIETALSNAAAEWESLVGMGVDYMTVRANEMKYQTIIDGMKTAKNTETLEDFQQQFCELIQTILKDAGIDVVEPEVCLHEHTEETVSAATCTEDGYRRVICSDCGETLENALVTKALGHAYDEGGVCERCGAVEMSPEDLLKCIEEAVANATAEWEKLPEMGVSMSAIRANELKYRVIVDNMKTAGSIEALEDCQRQFREMIQTILKKAGIDVTEPTT